MEELLKPDSFENYAATTEIYTKFTKLQDNRLNALSNGDDVGTHAEISFQKLREELTEMVEAVHFHNAKIEYLVDQLYSYNRRLTTLGGQILRLAARHKVPRKDFLTQSMGGALAANVLQREIERA